MENKHLFFPGPAAQEGFLWVFLLGSSPAQPRSCPGCAPAATEPSLPPPSVPGSRSPLSSRAESLWHQGPRLFLIPKSAVGLSLAQPQCKPNSSFLPSTLPEL